MESRKGVAIAGPRAGAAFGGEITGNGQPTAGSAHANSICVFSGQNDDPTAPLSLDITVAPNGPGGSPSRSARTSSLVSIPTSLIRGPRADLGATRTG